MWLQPDSELVTPCSILTDTISSAISRSDTCSQAPSETVRESHRDLTWSSSPTSCHLNPSLNAISNLLRSSLLLLILHQLHIILRNIRIILPQKVKNIITNIPLHRNFLPTRCRLRHRTPSSKLLPKLLGDLLQIQPELLQPTDLGHVLALIALHAFDDDFRGGALLGLAGLAGGGFGGFLLCVAVGAFLGVDGEAAEVLGEGVFAVQAAMEAGVVGGEPFFAFLGCAAVFTVLGQSVSVVCRICFL